MLGRGVPELLPLEHTEHTALVHGGGGEGAVKGGGQFPEKRDQTIPLGAVLQFPGHCCMMERWRWG